MEIISKLNESSSHDEFEYENQLRKKNIHFVNLKKSTFVDVCDREDEIKKIEIIIGCENRNSVLIIGESGVGKKALVHSLSKNLKAEKNILEVYVSSMLSGSSYRGEFEEKMHFLMQIAIQYNLIIFFDEAHTLSMTGSRESGSIETTIRCFKS